MADADSIRREADEILARAEYREPPRSLFQRALDWFLRQLSEAIASVSGGVPGGYLLGWFIVAVVVCGIGYMVWRVLPRGLRHVASAAPEPVLTASDRSVGRRAWLERAAAAEAAGDWRQATMARYRALVAGLVDRDELDDSPGATSGQHQREFEGSEPRRSSFSSVTRRFEDIWYGASPAEPGDPVEVHRADDDLLSSR